SASPESVKWCKFQSSKLPEPAAVPSVAGQLTGIVMCTPSVKLDFAGQAPTDCAPPLLSPPGPLPGGGLPRFALLPTGISLDAGGVAPVGAPELFPFGLPMPPVGAGPATLEEPPLFEESASEATELLSPEQDATSSSAAAPAGCRSTRPAVNRAGAERGHRDEPG